jgi:WXG100 family type VII secretion target
MEGNIKVSFGSLEALAGDINRQVGNIENSLTTLQSQISNIESLWVGASGSGFQLVKKQWEDSAQHLRQVLAKIQTAVVQSSDGYKDTEDRNTRRWDK